MTTRIALCAALTLFVSAAFAAEEVKAPDSTGKGTTSDSTDKQSTSQDKSADKTKDSGYKSDSKTADKAADKGACPTTVEGVLSKLHEDNLKEIAIGRLAAEKGTDPGVKELGAALVKDHTEAETEVKQCAEKEKIDLSKAAIGGAHPVEESRGKGLPDENAAAKKVDMKIGEDSEDAKKLKGLSGAEFDHQFSKMMVEDHKECIGMLDKVKQDEKLKSVHPLADKLRPALEKHGQMAKALSDKLDNKQAKN